MFSRPFAGACAGLLVLTLCATSAIAREDKAVRDTPYPGTISLAVDLRDTSHRIYRVQESIPVASGPVVLLYPRWIPGEHMPSGTIDNFAGLTIQGDGKRIAWRRDLQDMFAIHVDVPAGVKTLDVAFQFLSPGAGKQFGAGASATPDLTFLEWNQVVLYPAGYNARGITVSPSVATPSGWGVATALEAAGAADANGVTKFHDVSLETLVDSPLGTGRNFRQIKLSDSPVPVRLDLFADRAENLAVTDKQIHDHERLVKEAAALFGSHHYSHYDFLFVLSDSTAHFGLEHHQSSDDRIDADYFTNAEQYIAGGELLSHEYTHSWNGKFRRPAGLMSADFREPMKGDLLWVYEGQTEYWGMVLSGRAGIHNAEQLRDSFAMTASDMEITSGRTWRPLQDTADEAQVLYLTPDAWSHWRRSVDYYPEGALIWLDADTLIRELSGGQRSLDDFAKLFFGRDDGSFTPEPYTFDDVVAALDKVQHYDWARFLRERLDTTAPAAPLGGLTRAGWKLVYTEEPSELFTATAKERKRADFNASLGLSVQLPDENQWSDDEGNVLDAIVGGKAFEAGIAPGMKIIAVNGLKYSADGLRDAIKAAKSSPDPIELLVQDFDHFRTLKIDYHGGLRYPHLVRIDGTEDRLSLIGKAHAQ
jgi:predicted metalloprotease with PDZ domain